MPRGEPTAMLGVKLPLEMSEWLDSEAKRRETTKTAIVQEAIDLLRNGGKRKTVRSAPRGKRVNDLAAKRQANLNKAKGL
jgi:hypothetical protein